MSQLNTKIKQAPYIPGLKSGVLAAQRDKFKTPKVCIAAVRVNPFLLGEVGTSFSESVYEKICLAAVNEDGRAIECIPEDLRSKTICVAAARAFAISDERKYYKETFMGHIPREWQSTVLRILNDKEDDAWYNGPHRYS